ncbi:MAG: tetratricopeptide repeat protein [Planctomycetes bacterium]|nr:tetratricopeptide repeat protein [Planctomycetota bacterium]
MRDAEPPLGRSAVPANPTVIVGGVLTLVLLTVLAYLPALDGGFIFDDAPYIVENEALRSPAGLGQIWLDPASQDQYYPLTFSMYWLEYQLWGQNTRGYHLVNVILHALNAVLAWLLMRRLGLPGAFLVGLVFALHPVHVASVAWIAERKNVLSGACYLLAMLAWLHWAARGKWGAYAASLACFVLAVLAKTAVCTLPAALLLLTWWRGDREWRRVVLATLPFFVVALGAGLVTVWRERAYALGGSYAGELSPVESGLVAGRALWFYAGKLVWPANLLPIYPRWEVDTSAAWQYVFPLAALLVLAALWLRRRRLGRGPLVGALFFAVTLAPTLGLVDFGFMAYSYVADHFQYVASLGLIALAGVALAGAVRCTGGAARLVEAVLAAALLVVLGALTWCQAAVYQNAESFWTRSLEGNPTAPAYSALGDVYFARGELERAEECQRESLTLGDNAKARARLANVYIRRGQQEAALAELQRALELSRRGTRLRSLEGRILTNLGGVYLNLKEPQRAVECWREALAVNPRARRAAEWLAKIEGRGAAEDQPAQHNE